MMPVKVRGVTRLLDPADGDNTWEFYCQVEVELPNGRVERVGVCVGIPAAIRTSTLAGDTPLSRVVDAWYVDPSDWDHVSGYQIETLNSLKHEAWRIYLDAQEVYLNRSQR